jgi:hypothetical protein
MPQEVTGKYVVAWEKVNGDWKLAAISRTTPSRHASVCDAVVFPWGVAWHGERTVARLA